MQCIDERLDWAVEQAEMAGVVMLDNFDQPLEVEIKADRSPVTAVDKLINIRVMQALRRAFSK